MDDNTLYAVFVKGVRKTSPAKKDVAEAKANELRASLSESVQDAVTILPVLNG